MSYDSTKDTLLHIRMVNTMLLSMVKELLDRASSHDLSKLVCPEKQGFDKYTPLLKNLTYGSEEYKKSLEGLGETLKHHYQNNSHHPEHYEAGINGMCLLDVVEMLVDWKAATERHENGNIYKSLEYNKGRFSMSEQLCDILRNTIDRYLVTPRERQKLLKE